MNIQIDKNILLNITSGILNKSITIYGKYYQNLADRLIVLCDAKANGSILHYTYNKYTKYSRELRSGIVENLNNAMIELRNLCENDEIAKDINNLCVELASNIRIVQSINKVANMTISNAILLLNEEEITAIYELRTICEQYENVSK